MLNVETNHQHTGKATLSLLFQALIIIRIIAVAQHTGHFQLFSFILDRESYDFGRPKWHLLEMLKVPSTYRGMRIVYKYDDGFHDDFNVSEELPIEYYD